MALDLLPRPPGGFDGARRKLPVLARLLDEASNPLLSKSIDKLPVRVGIGKVAKRCQHVSQLLATRASYPMTPIDARISDSLRFWSLATVLRSWKIEDT